jgi:ABC-type polysaccharide/polyol phosphate export permease
VTATNVPQAVDDLDDFHTLHHVYVPHRTGIPSLRPYIRALWERRHFAAELSRSNIRAAHNDTFFGRLWLVLNPLLLAVVYFLLVDILSGAPKDAAYFAHLLAGLFAYYFVAGCITTGASSVVGGGKLIMNTAFPRLLLPFSAVRTAFYRFLPTMIVYGALHLIAGRPLGAVLLLSVPWFVLIALFAAGVAAFVATLQVYFRDLSSFLPYFLRIWLYVSPVLWSVGQITEKFQEHHIMWLAYLNPLYSLLGGWSDILTLGQPPTQAMFVAGTVWAVVAFVGGSLFFMSREREFAVRL